MDGKSEKTWSGFGCAFSLPLVWQEARRGKKKAHTVLKKHGNGRETMTIKTQTFCEGKAGADTGQAQDPPRERKRYAIHFSGVFVRGFSCFCGALAIAKPENMMRNDDVEDARCERSLFNLFLLLLHLSSLSISAL